MTRQEAETVCAEFAVKNALEFMSADYYPLLDRGVDDSDEEPMRSDVADGYTLNFGAMLDGEYWEACITIKPQLEPVLNDMLDTFCTSIQKSVDDIRAGVR